MVSVLLWLGFISISLRQSAESHQDTTANQIHFYGYPDGFEQVLQSSQLTVSGNCLQALYTLQTTTF